MALVTSPANERHFRMAPVFTDETVLILPSDHPLGIPASLSAADRAGVPGITAPLRAFLALLAENYPDSFYLPRQNKTNGIGNGNFQAGDAKT